MLTEREIANQEKATYEEMQRAQTSRIEMEKAKGTADMQGAARDRAGQRARSSRTEAERTRQAEAQGEAAYVELTGRGRGDPGRGDRSREAQGATEALGVARATGFEAQKEALGETATALVAVANAVAEGHITVVPEVLVTGGGGSFEGLAATLMRTSAPTGSVHRSPHPACRRGWRPPTSRTTTSEGALGTERADATEGDGDVRT